MAARADFRVGLVIGDILMTVHAARAVGANLDLVNVVAGGALGMAFAQRDIGQLVQPRQQPDLVTTGAAGLWGYRSAMRFVTGHAFAMPCGTLGELFLVAACAGEHSRRLVHGPCMATTAARMAQIAASLANLSHVASAADSAFAQLAEVEAMRLMTTRAQCLPCVKCGLRASFFVAVGTQESHLSDAFGVRFVTRDTRSPAFDGMRRDDVRMTSVAGLNSGRSHRMGLVAAAAVAVGASRILGEDLSLLVTRFTLKGARCRKRMGTMAVCT